MLYLLINLLFTKSLAYENVFGEPLERCSETGMALTGYTRTGSCVDQNDDAGSHHICIDLSSTTTPDNFCQVTGQSNWCDSEMSCDGGDGNCPVENWCVCQWAFSSYIAAAGGCDYIQDIVCDAINMEAVSAYTSSTDPNHKVALECIQTRCGLLEEDSSTVGIDVEEADQEMESAEDPNDDLELLATDGPSDDVAEKQEVDETSDGLFVGLAVFLISTLVVAAAAGAYYYYQNLGWYKMEDDQATTSGKKDPSGNQEAKEEVAKKEVA